MSDRSRRARMIVATRNAAKLREIASIYAHLNIELHSLADYVRIPEVREEGLTYADNAAAKARTAAEATGLVALADDSGIEVDALGGAPGVHSARYPAADATDAERSARILSLLEGIPRDRRTARYRAAIAVARPDGTVRIFEGVCEGRVACSPRGTGGFGYDPVFVPEGAQETIAQAPPEFKNRISHRARALRAAEPYLRELLGVGEKEQPARDGK
jgi:XTP/dITP diphosphohydrolase